MRHGPTTAFSNGAKGLEKRLASAFAMELSFVDLGRQSRSGQEKVSKLTYAATFSHDCEEYKNPAT